MRRNSDFQSKRYDATHVMRVQFTRREPVREPGPVVHVAAVDKKEVHIFLLCLLFRGLRVCGYDIRRKVCQYVCFRTRNECCVSVRSQEKLIVERSFAG
jgi:hypothetical protein